MMRIALLLTLLAVPAYAQMPPPFSAALLPKHGQPMRVVNEQLSITAKKQRMNLEQRDGFVTYTSLYTPKFHYLGWGQKLNFPGFVVTQPVRVTQEAQGVVYAFEGHEPYPGFDLDKYARMQILRKDDGTCEMSWALKNVLRGEVQDQAAGAVRYRCAEVGESLNASN